MRDILLILILLLALMAAAFAVTSGNPGAAQATPAAAGAAETVTTTVTVTVESTVYKTVTVTEAQRGDLFVPDRLYYRVAYELIRGARKCICLAVFIAKYDPGDPVDPANDLLRLLAEKAEEGVDVRVVVDDVTAREYPETISFLKSHGVRVKLDESSRRTMHAKLLIVDGEALLVGSHNWSEAALSYNREASMLTRDREVVEKALEWFEELWDRGRPA